MVHAASIGDEMTALLGDVVSVAVKVLIFLAIMGIGWLVARWLHRALAGFLVRVGFDRAVSRGGLNRMLGNYKASDLTARLVMFGFLLFVLQLAFGIFGPNPVSDLISSVIAWLPQLFVAVVIVVVTAAIAGWVRDIIAEALGGLSYGRYLATTAQVLVLILGITAALNQIGVASSVTIPLLIAVLATVAGVVIVGVGGGLVRPMTHRWERILNRAETETTLAAEKVRAHRATHAETAHATPRNVAFGQPAYTTGGATADLKEPEPDLPVADAEPPTVERPTTS